jgi:alpha-glucosidase
VQLIGHHETGGNAFHYEQQLEPAMALYERLGVHSVKTGYVADAQGARVAGPDGQMVMAWHESQAMAQHHMKVVEAGARHKVAINAHEPFKDTGLRRTYPNIISREGQRGHGIFGLGQSRQSARARAEPGLHPPAGRADGLYARHLRHGDAQPRRRADDLGQAAGALCRHLQPDPDGGGPAGQLRGQSLRPFQFIKDVPCRLEPRPARWTAAMGDYVAIAFGSTAASDVWALGAVTDEHPRVLKAPHLDFLDAGRRYRAEIYRDGPDADYRGKREDIVIEQREVTSADVP